MGMRKKLLLINPWIYDFTAYDLWSKPLGLLYMASFLREAGFEICLIDCLQRTSDEQNQKVQKYGVGHYLRTIVEKPPVLKHINRTYARYGVSEVFFVTELLKHKNADAVLLTSMMTYWYPGVQKAAELIRKVLPGKPIVLGGIYASLLPEHAKLTIRPDILIEGPGETKIIPALESLFNIKIDKSLLPKTVEEYPFPAVDLVKSPTYLTIMTARGCPYNCSFCAQQQVSMPFTKRSVSSVVKEFKEHYKKYQLKDFAFYDDALFITPKKHIIPILKELIQLKLPIRLHSPNGLFVRYIDAELAQLMYEANFKTICLSFETSNENRRKDMYSKVTNKDLMNAVNHLTAAGFKASEIASYILMGLPGQQIEEVLASMMFVHHLGVQIKLASFSPIHGTAEFHKAVKEGYIEENIDPLLTNKSIFPLYQGETDDELFRKIRTFSHLLNDAAKRSVILFDDGKLGIALKNVIKEMP
jgi:radical SAM superfamily enzyme YgiQ (UPF0313 family)